VVSVIPRTLVRQKNYSERFDTVRSEPDCHSYLWKVRHSFEFVDVTKPSIKAATQHDVRHYIETNGIHVADRSRRLSGEKLVTAKRKIIFLIEQGICRPSKSPWSTTSRNNRKERRFFQTLIWLKHTTKFPCRLG